MSDLHNPTTHQMQFLQSVYAVPGQSWDGFHAQGIMAQCERKGWVMQDDGHYHLTEAGHKVYEARK